MTKEAVLRRIVARFQTRCSNKDDLLSLMQGGLVLCQDILAWSDQFPGVLRAAEQEAQGLPDGWVWQNRFVKLISQYEPLEDRLRDLDSLLEDAYLDAQFPTKIDVANAARGALALPPKGQVSRATSKLKFFEHPVLGRSHIAYEVDNLKEWAQVFKRWVESSIQTLQTEIRKLQRWQKRRSR